LAMFLDLYGPSNIFFFAVFYCVKLFDIVHDSNSRVWCVHYIALLFGPVLQLIIALPYNTNQAGEIMSSRIDNLAVLLSTAEGEPGDGLITESDGNWERVFFNPDVDLVVNFEILECIFVFIFSFFFLHF